MSDDAIVFYVFLSAAKTLVYKSLHCFHLSLVLKTVPRPVLHLCSGAVLRGSRGATAPMKNVAPHFGPASLDFHLNRPVISLIQLHIVLSSPPAGIVPPTAPISLVPEPPLLVLTCHKQADSVIETRNEQSPFALLFELFAARRRSLYFVEQNNRDSRVSEQFYHVWRD